MIRRVALLLGIGFLALGILGFVEASGRGLLLGVFAVDQTHNIVHAITGAVGLLAVATGRSRLYCQLVGVIYTLIGILGLIASLSGHQGTILVCFHVNQADNILHLVVGIVAAYFGFAYGSRWASNVSRQRRFGWR